VSGGTPAPFPLDSRSPGRLLVPRRQRPALGLRAIRYPTIHYSLHLPAFFCTFLHAAQCHLQSFQPHPTCLRENTRVGPPPSSLACSRPDHRGHPYIPWNHELPLPTSSHTTPCPSRLPLHLAFGCTKTGPPFSRFFAEWRVRSSRTGMGTVTAIRTFAAATITRVIATFLLGLLERPRSAQASQGRRLGVLHPSLFGRWVPCFPRVSYSTGPAGAGSKG